MPRESGEGIEPERHPRPRRDNKAFRERPVLFQEYGYTPQSIQQLYSVALEMGGEDTLVTSSVFPHGHA